MRFMVARLVVLCCLTVACWGHDAPASQTGAPGQNPEVGPPPSPAELEMKQRVQKARAQERFAQIKKDTDHLLELATQLKKSVDEASDQTLSLEVIRKAEQIEKLAKQVRQKMAGD
ncbi:MAG: hypothetical protein WA188_21355 [Terriglobales bacterium]